MLWFMLLLLFLCSTRSVPELPRLCSLIQLAFAVENIRYNPLMSSACSQGCLTFDSIMGQKGHTPFQQTNPGVKKRLQKKPSNRRTTWRCTPCSHWKEDIQNKQTNKQTKQRKKKKRQITHHVDFGYAVEAGQYDFYPNFQRFIWKRQ